MNNKQQKCFFSGPKSYTIIKMCNFAAQIIKICFIYILIVILFLVQMKVNFFHLNLLVSNFYFWSTMLTQMNHTIVNIFSGTLTVTVNIYKKTEILYLKVKSRVFLSKDTRKNI